MNSVKIISLYSWLMFNFMMYGMEFQNGDFVQIVKGSHKGEVAIVSAPFAKAWPGEKVKNLPHIKFIASYLEDASESQPIGIEKFLYCVHIGNELILVRQDWMKKIPTTVNAHSKKEQEEPNK